MYQTSEGIRSLSFLLDYSATPHRGYRVSKGFILKQVLSNNCVGECGEIGKRCRKQLSKSVKTHLEIKTNGCLSVGSIPATYQHILSFIIGFRGPQSLALAAAFFKIILCNK
jgi:hypothetical protein